MKKALSEVQKLQKVAGVLKENVQEATLTINQVVKQLNKIANSKGFYAVDKSKDEKPTKGAFVSTSGIKNLVKWEDGEGGFVELYYDTSVGPKVTANDLEINFAGDYASGNDPVDVWLDPATWDEQFSESDEEAGYDNEEDIKEAIKDGATKDGVQSVIDSKISVLKRVLIQLNTLLDKGEKGIDAKQVVEKAIKELKEIEAYKRKYAYLFK